MRALLICLFATAAIAMAQENPPKAEAPARAATEKVICRRGTRSAFDGFVEEPAFRPASDGAQGRALAPAALDRV